MALGSRVTIRSMVPDLQRVLPGLVLAMGL